MVIITNQSLHHYPHFHPPHPHQHHLHPFDQVGLPLRREDGSCMAPSDTCNPLVILLNIAKGTTDPRVEFISQVQTQILIKSHLQSFDEASTSKSQPNTGM